MNETPQEPAEPANLRFLRILVTILTGSMILGLVTIIALIVIRVPDVVRTVTPPAPLPDTISLPDGTKATAFTRGPDWYAIVTEKNEILIFDAESNTLSQTIRVR